MQELLSGVFLGGGFEVLSGSPASICGSAGSNNDREKKRASRENTPDSR